MAKPEKDQKDQPGHMQAIAGRNLQVSPQEEGFGGLFPWWETVNNIHKTALVGAGVFIQGLQK